MYTSKNRDYMNIYDSNQTKRRNTVRHITSPNNTLR